MHLKKREFLQQLSCASLIASLSPSALLGQASQAKDQQATTIDSEAIHTEPNPIRIGQIGMAHGHADKLQIYRQSPDYEVVGIVEENEELYQRRRNERAFANIPRMTRAQLLATPGLQAVLIESEIPDLLPNGLACIQAGKHIHLDKPAGESLEEFSLLLEEARRQSLVVQMGYMYRYNPAFVMLKEFVRKGWLGEIFEIHAVMSKKVGVEERNALARYPGGMMFELGCHLIDIIVDLLGEPEQIAAHKSRASYWEDTLWDNMLAVFQYPNAIASVKSSCLEVNGGGRRHFVVCGSKGTFHIEPLDNPRVRLTLEEPTGMFAQGTHWIDLPKYVRYVDDAKEMAEAIRGEKQFPFSYDHDLATQRTILKASGL